MGTDGKFSHVSLRTNQKLQETFRLSPSIPSFQVSLTSEAATHARIRIRYEHRFSRGGHI
jgi:hypothetical protein